MEDRIKKLLLEEIDKMEAQIYIQETMLSLFNRQQITGANSEEHAKQIVLLKNAITMAIMTVAELKERMKNEGEKKNG